MEMTAILSLNLKASRIALGTWSIGGWMWGGTDEEESIRTILKALDLGVNVIDTAPVYGFGLSEEIIGKALKQHGKREDVILVTKAGLSWKGEKVYRDAREDVIKKEVEASLKRLQVEYIDLYLIHWPDPKTDALETAHALNSLLYEGKIKAIGVSNFSLEQMQDFQRHAPIHALQSPFNLFEHDIENKELAYCKSQKIATLGYGGLCRGLLAGKMSKSTVFTGDDIRKRDPKFQEPRYSQYLACVDKLKTWADTKHQKTILALALRWALDKGISMALWGARHPEQLKGVEEVSGWHLTQQDFAEIDQIIKETVLQPIGPEFMAPPARAT